MNAKKFAFLIHPRSQVSSDITKLFNFAPLRLIPDGTYEAAMKRLPIPPLVTGQLRRSDAPNETAGWLVTVPLGARQLLELPRRFVQDKVAQAVDKAAELGAEIVGLGALTAPATLGGKTLEARQDVGITNGNAFTAAMTWMGIQRLLSRLPSDPHIAVVGATGSVGSCLIELLAKRPLSSQLTLVARHQGRLEALAKKVCRDGLEVNVSTDMTSVREADLVVLLTSSSEALLGSEHLKDGAVVLDDTQPRNTDSHLQTQRPDVLIVDGGLVEAPGIIMRGRVGLPKNMLYACLAETILLGLEGHSGHFGIGAPKLEQAEYMLTVARKHAKLGFHLAPLHSFGQLLEPVQAPVRIATSAQVLA